MAEAKPSTDNMTAEQTSDNTNAESERPGLIKRLRTFDSRAVFFIVACLVMVGLAFGGVVTVGSGVEVSREESVEIARDHVNFEPEKAEARLFRQGFRLVPVWGVSFSIPDEDGASDFERLTTVEVDARTGDVIRISVDKPDEE